MKKIVTYILPVCYVALAVVLFLWIDGNEASCSRFVLPVYTLLTTAAAVVMYLALAQLPRPSRFALVAVDIAAALVVQIAALMLVGLDAGTRMSAYLMAITVIVWLILIFAAASAAWGSRGYKEEK